jgi:hypothetical protein
MSDGAREPQVHAVTNAVPHAGGTAGKRKTEQRLIRTTWLRAVTNTVPHAGGTAGKRKSGQRLIRTN